MGTWDSVLHDNRGICFSKNKPTRDSEHPCSSVMCARESIREPVTLWKHWCSGFGSLGAPEGGQVSEPIAWHWSGGHPSWE